MPLLLGRPVGRRGARAWRGASASSTRGFARARHARRAPGVPAFVARWRVRACRARSAPRPRAATWSALLGELGLRRHFDVVVTADDVRCGKPDPEVYLRSGRGGSGRRPPAASSSRTRSSASQAARARRHARRSGVTTAHTDAELRAAGAERAIPDFEGLEWTALARRERARLLGGPLRRRRATAGSSARPRRRSSTGRRGSGLPPPRRADARVAVPGCGRGHDARFLAASRLSTSTASTSRRRRSTEARALAAARRRRRSTFEQRDIFTLGRRPHGAFDGVWEYTCFCAIDPARRDEYVRTVGARSSGRAAGSSACFFPLREREPTGPPFPVSRDEIERAPPLGPRFRIERAQPPLRSAERPPGPRVARRWPSATERAG